MLEARDIAFAYDRRRILDGVTFKVASGETVALVGANGAGKTTLMRLLAGLLVPASGTLRVDGFDAFREPIRYRRMLGYLPESTSAEPDLTVKAYLKFRAKLKGEQSRKIRHRVMEALEACALVESADVRIRKLSNGQRRRVALADALLLRPRILLADDLFAGIDTATRTSLVQAIGTFSQFASVVLSGHELDDLGRCATRFLVLKDGRIMEVKGAAGTRVALMRE